ncbi:MAG TPA: glycosyltransferase family 4 protein [Bryobacteraceae bacterium]|jgi:glycosyltransferase involved in cell wall biosynthesis
MKVCLWLLLPTHYHRAFAREVAKRCDAQVVYFNRFTADRIALGWREDTQLAPYEHWDNSLSKLTTAIPDWKDRVHVIPNYGEPFTRMLTRFLIRNGAEWADWSESSRPGWRWIARSPWKAWWTFVVRRHALGSFYAGLRAERDFALRGLTRSRTAFLPWVCDPPSTHTVDTATVDFNRGRNAFLYLGALSHRKGTDVLLKAAASALRTKPDWSLVIVGNDRPDNYYRKLADSLNLHDQVLFRGAVQPDLLGTILAACKVLILPSRYDGWGLALNEGLLSGLALISSHMCGAGDHLVISGKNGFRFQAGNTQQLAELMRIYIRNPGLAEEHGAASRLMSNIVDPGQNAEIMLSTLNAWRTSKA